jgi:hypothetical protein
MKTSRIILIVAAIAGLVVAGVLIYVLTNINSIVEAAIEKYGTQAAGTNVSVSSVDIKLPGARGTINGLRVANPPGFSSPDIFKLGSISTRIDPKSIRKAPIVIDEIRITGPEVFYEINGSGASNLDELKKRLESQEKKPAKKAEGKEVRLLIRKLIFEQGRIEARLPSGTEPLAVNLPRIELSDIGKNGGATPGQIATILVTALAQESIKAVSHSQIERLKKGAAEKLRKGAKELFKQSK